MPQEKKPDGSPYESTEHQGVIENCFDQDTYQITMDDGESILVKSDGFDIRDEEGLPTWGYRHRSVCGDGKGSGKRERKMAETDHKEKIRKLLALAESPNEHEAKAALLKARELMAKHKLAEAELKDVERQTVEKVLTDITCSKRRDPWIVRLSSIIGENYCCKAYRNHRKGKQTFTIGFIGLKDDVEICTAIFKYAVDCALSKIKEIRAVNSPYYTGDHVASLCHSYGYGFADGIDTAFQKQKEENEQGWGLVMVIPKEVEDAANSLGRARFTAKAAGNIYRSEYNSGYRDGKAFDPTKRLAGT